MLSKWVILHSDGSVVRLRVQADFLVTVVNIQPHSTNGRVCLGSQLHGTEGTEGQSCGEGRVGQSHRHRGTQEAEAERSPLTDFLLSPDHSICAPGQRDETAKGLFSWIILIGIPRLFG